jgi:uncharacterized protein (TIGR02996 family)
MTDEAFLQSIREDPDADGPRLMYADWLEERGDPRGEFIRTQCALAREPQPAGAEELRAREKKLLAANRAKWNRPFKGLPVKVGYRRGFVERISCPDVPAFLEVADAVFAAAPVQELQFERGRGAVPPLVALPHLARVRALRFGLAGVEPKPLTGIMGGGAADATPQGARALAASRHVTGLRALAIRGGPLGPKGVEALAVSARLAGLTSLDLYDTGCGDAGARAVAESPHWRKLTELSLEASHVGDPGVEALAASPNMAGVRTLNLFCNELWDRGARALAASPYLGRLTQLRLSPAGDLNDEARQALLARFNERAGTAIVPFLRGRRS